MDLADYTNLIRAEILHNHVYFSSLDDASRRWFALPEAHRPIVEHRNFSPRLIAWSLTTLPEGDSPALAADTVLDRLDHPEHLWAHIVENQLSQDDLDLVLVLCRSRRPCRSRQSSAR